MTEERMALLELVEKQADSDLVRDMLAFAAERIMEAEIEARTGAAKGARTPMREVQRNGYRDRDWVDEDKELIRGINSPRRAGWADRAGDPQAQEGQLLPQLSGAAPDGREGARGRHSRGLCPWRLDALDR